MLKKFEYVKLMYPNNFCNLTNSEFNWYICSRIKRDENGNFIIILTKSSKFYCNNTGDILRPKKKDIKLLLLNETEDFSFQIQKLNSSKNISKIFKLVSDYGFDGFATRTEGKDFFPVCERAVFVIKSNLLEIENDKDNSNIISFSRKENLLLKEKDPEFPSCKEISDCKESCCKINKKLYSKIRKMNNRLDLN